MIIYINNYEEGAGNIPHRRRIATTRHIDPDPTHHHMTNETIEAIFHDWRPREIAAMQIATAWLRAMQTEEWQYKRQQIVQAQSFEPLRCIK